MAISRIRTAPGKSPEVSQTKKCIKIDQNMGGHVLCVSKRYTHTQVGTPKSQLLLPRLRGHDHFVSPKTRSARNFCDGNLASHLVCSTVLHTRLLVCNNRKKAPGGYWGLPQLVLAPSVSSQTSVTHNFVSRFSKLKKPRPKVPPAVSGRRPGCPSALTQRRRQMRPFAIWSGV